MGVALTALCFVGESRGAVLADSVLGFSTTQGTNGWSYGWAIPALNCVGPLPTGMPTWSVYGSPGDWSGPFPFSGLAMAGGYQGDQSWHPGQFGGYVMNQTRTWTATAATSGSVTISGLIAKIDTAGDGVIGDILLNGVSVYNSGTVTTAAGSTFNFNLPALQAGDKVSMVLNANANWNSDATKFTMRIADVGTTTTQGTWVGGTDLLWETGANWGGVSPNGTYDSATFAANPGTVTIGNTTTATSVASLNFVAGATAGTYLTGGTINVGQGIYNSSASQKTINSAIQVDKNITVFTGAYAPGSNNGSRLNTYGAISGAGMIYKAGGNQQDVNGGAWDIYGQSPDWTGGLYIAQGVVRLSANNAVGTTGTIYVAPNANLQFLGGTPGSYDISGRIVSPFWGNWRSPAYISAGNRTFAGAITGAGSVAYWDGGTVTLTGASTYEGQTQIANYANVVIGGNAIPGSPSPLGTPRQNVWYDNDAQYHSLILGINSGPNTFMVNGNYTMGLPLYVHYNNAGTTHQLGGATDASPAYTAEIWYGAGAAGPVLRFVSASTGTNSVTFSGGIRGRLDTGPSRLVFYGPGNITLAGQNAYASDTNVVFATLKMGSTDAIPYGNVLRGNIGTYGVSGVFGNVVLNGTASTTTAAGALDLNGYNTKINGLSGTGDFTSVTLGRVINSVPGTKTLALGYNDQTAEFAGLIQDNTGSGGGNVAITKVGLGTQTLSGLNTYTGPTTVNGGMLVLNATVGATIGSNSPIVFNGLGTFAYRNTGSLTQSGTVGNISFNKDSGTVWNSTNGAYTNWLTTGTISRAAGAVGNFNFTYTVGNTSDPNYGDVAIIPVGQAAGFIDGGVYINDLTAFVPGEFAYVDTTSVPGYPFIRAPIYGSDAGFVNVAGGQLSAQDGNHISVNNALTGQGTALPASLRINGANNITMAGGGILAITSGGLIKTSGGTSTISGGSGITTGSTSADLVVRASGTNDWLNLSTPILSSTGGLTISGNGTVVLNAANAYVGPSSIIGATVIFGNTNSLGVGNDLFVSGGVLDLNGNAPGAAVTSLAGNLGVITDNTGNSNTVSTLMVNDSVGTRTFSGNIMDGTPNPDGISGATKVRLEKSGPGWLILTGGTASNFTGGTKISGGTLSMTNGSLGTAGPVNVSNATLSFTPYTYNGSAAIDSSRLTIGTASTDTAVFDVNWPVSTGQSNKWQQYGNYDAWRVNIRGSNGNMLSGTGNLEKTGSGTLEIWSWNYDGTTRVKEGMLLIHSGGTHGTNTIYIGGVNSPVDASIQAFDAVVVSNPIVVEAGTGVRRLVCRGGNGVKNFSGPITLNKSLYVGTEGIGSGPALSGTDRYQNFTGPISGVGGIIRDRNLQENPAWWNGVSFGNSNNTYTGDTVLNWGITRIAAPNVGTSGPIPFGPGTGNLVMDASPFTTNSALPCAMLDLNGYDTTVNGLSGSYSSTDLYLPWIVNNVASTATVQTSTLTVGNGNATTTFNGLLLNTSTTSLTARLALTKVGSGTITLAGPSQNLYTGLTTVSDGWLVAAKSMAFGDPGDILVNGSAARMDLGGYATLAGAVTLTDGQILSRPGPATLTGTSYVVSNGSISVNLGANAATLTKTTTGSVTLSGTNAYTGITTVQGGQLTLVGTGAQAPVMDPCGRSGHPEGQAHLGLHRREQPGGNGSELAQDELQQRRQQLGGRQSAVRHDGAINRVEPWLERRWKQGHHHGHLAWRHRSERIGGWSRPCYSVG